MIPATIGPVEGEIFAVTLFGIAAGLLLFVPLIDREGNTNRWVQLLRVSGWAAVIYIVVMTLLGYRA
jgi:quinol-cytochrome oxidoreductase complex cytochrome b subunit